MISVRSLVGATATAFALAVSSISANAASNPPGIYNLTAPETFIGGHLLGANITNVLDVFTFNFAPTLSAVSTSVSLDGNGGTTHFGIANLFYQWGGGPAVQVSDSLGNALEATSPGSTTISGLLTSSPLVITLFTFNGTTLANGGSYQLTLTVNQCDGPNCAPPEVPIPGAVVLFGSVLAGGVGGVQIMRRRRKALAA